MFSVAEVQTKVISSNSANKNYLLQVVQTKAIAALTQFCDFFQLEAVQPQLVLLLSKGIMLYISNA